MEGVSNKITDINYEWIDNIWYNINGESNILKNIITFYFTLKLDNYLNKSFLDGMSIKERLSITSVRHLSLLNVDLRENTSPLSIEFKYQAIRYKRNILC